MFLSEFELAPNIVTTLLFYLNIALPEDFQRMIKSGGCVSKKPVA